ncbi:MAG: hypothetical protein ACWGQW_09145 [bacterium]
MIGVEDFESWQCLWDQLSLVVARLELLSRHKISSADSLKQISALVDDIEVAQSFMKLTAPSVADIASPMITEVQERLSLSLANMEIVARKLKGIPGASGSLSEERLRVFRKQLAESQVELTTAVTAAFQRLKLI